MRSLRDGDLGDLVALINNWEVARWVSSVPHPYTEADAADYVGRAARWWREGSFFPFAVTDASGGRLLGAVGLTAAPATTAKNRRSVIGSASLIGATGMRVKPSPP
jgi:RimJ/RimL family protein N-acetyltransferase